MGEDYCNDPRCQGNRNGEKHKAHGEQPYKEEKLERTVDIVDTYTGQNYCNDPRCQRNRNGEKHKAHTADDPDYYYIKYIAVHKAYPRPTDTRISFYDEIIELDNPHLVIPYSSMKNLENFDEKKISAKRVVALGLVAVPLAIVGAMWKKNHIYTVIQYHDEMDDHTIVLDLEEYLDSAQPLIYRKMLQFRKRVEADR